ncbi:MAG TPA: tRNA (adenosine(37)-N6)-threonylcarbamoyltransferase complex ATPase subunit type 1 TsaE [Clostridiales bacterium]|nr:tRNA (adenosine(37)-N6)-threonylcarbamoyltransferase complex ATPase subunit type 1 TsaE [Clostridiales bacterium]
MKIESYKEKDTYNIGYSMGQKAKSGEIYCLSGDLGVGKTVFTQGFAAGLGVVDIVNSPTFTIVHEYNGKLPFYHFDVYRISDVEEMYDIGFEEYLEGGGVCLIEWAELIKAILPSDCIKVKIKKDLSKNFDYREIYIS